MPDRPLIPGKFVWFELVSKDAKRAQAFYGEVLGWRTHAFPMGPASYDMILTGESLDTMIGGYAEPKPDRAASRWLAYVSVEDVDAASKAARENGGTVLDQPVDIPNVGRRARIADPLGAELCLIRRADGDPPDNLATPGRFFWNELHTSDATKALAFYEKVVGFTHRSLGMGQDTYHIISRGDVDRGGVTPDDGQPHWLPYVFVEDPDAALTRAERLGGKISVPANDIPDIGRYGVLEDPTGAVLAVMKPSPRQKS